MSDSEATTRARQAALRAAELNIDQWEHTEGSAVVGWVLGFRIDEMTDDEIDRVLRVRGALRHRSRAELDQLVAYCARAQEIAPDRLTEQVWQWDLDDLHAELERRRHHRRVVAALASLAAVPLVALLRNRRR